MLVLLDNCLPVKLRERIPGHAVETAVYRGWAALENGALVAAAIDAGFDAVVTIDQGHDFARAVAGRPIIAILLPGSQGSRLDDVLPLVEAIGRALDTALPGATVRL
jgi:predicted nuclease of predicted toxin-antitoxin system